MHNHPSGLCQLHSAQGSGLLWPSSVAPGIYWELSNVRPNASVRDLTQSLQPLCEIRFMTLNLLKKKLVIWKKKWPTKAMLGMSWWAKASSRVDSGASAAIQCAWPLKNFSSLWNGSRCPTPQKFNTLHAPWDSVIFFKPTNDWTK